jgi:hypothetical protein
MRRKQRLNEDRSSLLLEENNKLIDDLMDEE